MKVVFNVDNVRTAVQSAQRVVNKKNTLPILDNLLLQVAADTRVLNIVGSDLETQVVITTTILEADEDASICVNAARLNAVLAKLSASVLRMEIDKEKKELAAYYDGGTFLLPFEPSTDYPLAATRTDGDHKDFAVSSSRIVWGVDRTLFAASTDEIRPVLSGVFFDFSKEGLICVATDTRLLIKYTDKSILTGDVPYSFILSRKSASLFRALFGSDDCSINIALDDGWAIFSTETLTFSCRLIEGRYPKYDTVIPTVSTANIYIDRKALIETLSRITVFAPQSGLVILSFDNRKVYVSCQDTDFSLSASETLNIAYEGEKITLGFNASLLYSLLQNIQTNDVQINLIDNAHAAVFLPFGSTDEDIEMVSLIMPMQVV